MNPRCSLPFSTRSVLKVSSDRNEAREDTDAHAEQKLVTEKPQDICIKIMEKTKVGDKRIKMRRNKVENWRDNNQTNDRAKHASNSPLDH